MIGKPSVPADPEKVKWCLWSNVRMKDFKYRDWPFWTIPTVVSMIMVASSAAKIPSDDYVDWPEFAISAKNIVEKESPPTAFPFKTAVTGRGKALVVAHYFPFFPLSYDGLLPAKDYYATQFMLSSGENGKHSRQGGFLRERPLPAPFGSIPRFREANFSVEVARATRIGIDGFGVNILSLTDTTFMPTARKLLDAAQASETEFKVFPEPDMSVLPGLVPAVLADALMPFATHSAALRVDGALLVMPIAAESYPPAFWRQLVIEMRRRGYPIALMPCYYDPAPASLAKLRDTSWGATFWGTRGPTAGDIASNVVGALKKVGFSHWMIPVSPQDARPKDLRAFEAGNSESYRNQWNTAIALRAKQVQIITWNDYSETSEISPSSFSQFVFYDLTAYYTAWLKAGAAPALTRDAFYFIQRRQIFRPDTAVQGARWSRAGDAPWSNEIEVVVLLTKPGELVLHSGDAVVHKMVGSGLQTIHIPASPGTATVTLRRDRRTIVTLKSPVSVDIHPDRHDPTYGGNSSLRVSTPTDSENHQSPPSG